MRVLASASSFYHLKPPFRRPVGPVFLHRSRANTPLLYNDGAIVAFSEEWPISSARISDFGSRLARMVGQRRQFSAAQGSRRPDQYHAHDQKGRERPNMSSLRNASQLRAPNGDPRTFRALRRQLTGTAPFRQQIPTIFVNLSRLAAMLCYNGSVIDERSADMIKSQNERGEK